MRELSRLDILGSGLNYQPMLFSPQKKTTSQVIRWFLWHPWPKCLLSHHPAATTLDLLSTTYPHLFFFSFFHFKFLLTVVEVVVMSPKTHTLLLTRVWDRKQVRAQILHWLTLGQTDSRILTYTGALLCLACSTIVSVYTACDSSA